jgi:hypothetical protein
MQFSNGDKLALALQLGALSASRFFHAQEG